MSFNLVDLSNWKRKPYYEHYMADVRCSYSVTVNIEVEALARRIKSLRLKSYPVQIYLISQVVNAYPEFRMALNSNGEVGCWDSTSPSYTIFNQATKTFSSIYTPYSPNFAEFYENCVKDMASYADSEALFPQCDMPENLFTVSSLPWLSFTGFNLNVYSAGDYLPPIFTIGRYLEQNGKRQMPLSIQVHHAVCDGYHLGRFVESLQDMANRPEGWLKTVDSPL